MNISFSLRGLEKLAAGLTSIPGRIKQFVQGEGLDLVQRAWTEAVSRTPTVRTAEYVAAIQNPADREYPADGDPYFSRIAITEQKVVEVVIDKPAWDMKPGLLGGPKARRGKKGQRYNVIPLGQAPDIFRTVSDFSPAPSWWYPARKGTDVREEVMETITPVIVSFVKKIATEWRT